VVVIIIYQLGSGARRFNELRRDIDGISQRMLSVTLRGLERDGLVSRVVYPVTPPRVDYALTDFGRTLLATVAELMGWAEANFDQVQAARTRYDAREKELKELT
jgi:DNA-binding HxlR family transcriptional regulator